jgi:hypothetical protein
MLGSMLDSTSGNNSLENKNIVKAMKMVARSNKYFIPSKKEINHNEIE